MQKVDVLGAADLRGAASRSSGGRDRRSWLRRHRRRRQRASSSCRGCGTPRRSRRRSTCGRRSTTRTASRSGERRPSPFTTPASLPIAYKPEMQADGAGGAVLRVVRERRGFFEGRVQHLNAAGAEVFPHNGVEISLEPSRSELYPSFVQLGGDLIVFYNKRNSGQSLVGDRRTADLVDRAALCGEQRPRVRPLRRDRRGELRAPSRRRTARCASSSRGNFANRRSSASASTATASRVVAVADARRARSRAARTSCARSPRPMGPPSSSGTTPQRRREQRLRPERRARRRRYGVPPALATPTGAAWNPPGTLVVVVGRAVDRHVFTVGVNDPRGRCRRARSRYSRSRPQPGPSYPVRVRCRQRRRWPAPGLVGRAPRRPRRCRSFPSLTGHAWTTPGSPVAFPFPIPHAVARRSDASTCRAPSIDPGLRQVGVDERPRGP